MEANDGSRTYDMVVVQTFSSYSVGLMLRDTVAAENDVAIKGRGIMHCDTGRLCYAYNDKFQTFVRALSDQEFNVLKDKICATLDLTWNSGYCEWDENAEAPQFQAFTPEDMEALTCERDALQTRITDLTAELEKERQLHSARIDGPELATIRDDLIATRAERDTYKRLYDDTMSRLLRKEV